MSPSTINSGSRYSSSSTMSRCAGHSIFTTLLTTLILLTPLASAHFEIVYPPWRGNTLKNEMQWDYPCGGIPPTNNRTAWPITGGSISVIPGWNSGHPTAFFYINMGYGTNPVNHSMPMHQIFQITGPSRDAYAGQFCLPFVPLPANATELGAAKVGDNATIQIIQVALHGASLYNCADITFVEPGQEDPMVGECTNTTTIGFNQVFATRSRSSDGSRSVAVAGTSMIIATGLIAVLFGLL